MQRRPLLFLLAVLPGCGAVSEDGGEDLGTLREGCAVMLRMDEPSWSGPGSVIDACGGDHDGTPSGTIATTQDGVRGRAGRFLGDGCITIDDAPALRAGAALTMSAWVLPTALNDVDAYGVISKRLDMELESAYNLTLWTENHAWVDIEGKDNRFANKTQLVNNRWTQLTVVYDGARRDDTAVRIFVNGALDAHGPEAAASISPYTAPLRVGCLPSPSNQTMQYFEGLLDEVAVWTRALSDAEITQWFEATRPR
jgi:hypothetical protein